MSQDTRTGQELFALGQCSATPGALKALEESNESPIGFLVLHNAGFWGEVGPEDAQANEDALLYGGRIFSVYKTDRGETLWLITESDRSYTTILLPGEY